LNIWNSMAAMFTRVIAAARAVIDAPFNLPPARRRLFAFEHPAALDRWYAYTDEQDGGRSTATWSHEARAAGGGGVARLAGRLETGFDEALDQEARATPASFSGARMVRSGYASVRSLEPAPFGELDDFDGLAVVLRSDSRPYVLNIKTTRMMADSQELFQVLLPPSPPLDAVAAAAAHHRPQKLARGEVGPWREIRVPFDEFRLTWRGFVQPQDIKLDPRRIESVGLAIYAADPKHADLGYAAMHGGPFTLELRSIDAYGSSLGTMPVDAHGRQGGVTQVLVR
jgi:hypothetical protein